MGRHWLRRWDERNQAVSDWLIDHPDAGTKGLPYAKSDRARRVLWAVIAVTLLGGWVLGSILGSSAVVITWVVGVVLVGVLSQRLEHHPGRDRYRRLGDGPRGLP